MSNKSNKSGNLPEFDELPEGPILDDLQCTNCGHPVEIGGYTDAQVREFYLFGVGACCYSPDQD